MVSVVLMTHCAQVITDTQSANSGRTVYIINGNRTYKNSVCTTSV